MLIYVLLAINIIVLGTVGLLSVRQRGLKQASLKINELSRLVNDLPGNEFRVEMYEQLGYVAEYLDDIDTRINIIINTSNALRNDHNTVVEQTNTMLTISEELSGEVFSIKEAMSEFDKQLEELDGYITDINEGNSMIEQGFYATVTSITKLQEAQKITRDLLDATIDSFDWDEDENPVDLISEHVEVEEKEVPMATSLPPVSMDEEPPIVEPRKDGDPLITDLRAVPFEEASTGGPDPYALGYTPDVEDWPTDFSSDSNSTSRSKTRRIRRLR